MLRIAAASVALVSAASFGPVASGDAAVSDWVVIVNPANSVRALNHTQLERIYRRTTRFWDDGAPILPINLPASAPLRAAFSEAVLHSDPDSLATYWNRQYFQGVLPPLVLQSPEAVRAYVARTEGAIGYVPAADVDGTVAVVSLTDDR